MSETRQYIRSLIRQKRQSLKLSEQQAASDELLNTFKRSPFSQNLSTKKVALYLANDGELNPQAVIEYCWQQGAEVYLPVLHPFCKGYLLFLQYRCHDQLNMDLIHNRYGIIEPKLDVTKVCPANQLDIVFTPLVAFDLQGNRLGMGGGYYDRSFEFSQRPQLAAPILVGLAHDCQRVNKLPAEAWDVPLAHIITPMNYFQY